MFVLCKYSKYVDVRFMYIFKSMRIFLITTNCEFIHTLHNLNRYIL